MKRAIPLRAQKARNSRSGPASRRRRSARRSGSTAAVFRSWTRRARASSSTSAAMRSMTARTRARSTATTARSGQSADGRRLAAGGQLSASRCASQPAHCRSQLTSSDSRPAMLSRPSSSVSSRSLDPRGRASLLPAARRAPRPARPGQAAATSWCTREGDRPAAVARVRIEIPLGAGRDQRPRPFRPACSSRHAARETRVRTRRSRRPASIRALIVTRPSCQPRSGN